MNTDRREFLAGVVAMAVGQSLPAAPFLAPDVPRRRVDIQRRVGLSSVTLPDQPFSAIQVEDVITIISDPNDLEHNRTFMVESICDGTDKNGLMMLQVVPIF